MKFITTNLTTILIVVIAVFTTIQLKSCLDGGKKAPDISGEIKAKDDIIQMIQDERQQDRRMFDSTISVLKQQDGNKVTEYKTIVTKYEKIPVYINNLNRDSLRSAVNNY